MVGHISMNWCISWNLFAFNASNSRFMCIVCTFYEYCACFLTKLAFARYRVIVLLYQLIKYCGDQNEKYRLGVIESLLNFNMQVSESDPLDRLRSVSWTSDKFPPPGLGLARVSHQVLQNNVNPWLTSPTCSKMTFEKNYCDRINCLRQFHLGFEMWFLEWSLFLR